MFLSTSNSRTIGHQSSSDRPAANKNLNGTVRTCIHPHRWYATRNVPAANQIRCVGGGGRGGVTGHAHRCAYVDFRGSRLRSLAPFSGRPTAWVTSAGSWFAAVAGAADSMTCYGPRTGQCRGERRRERGGSAFNKEVEVSTGHSPTRRISELLRTFRTLLHCFCIELCVRPSAYH